MVFGLATRRRTAERGKQRRRDTDRACSVGSAGHRPDSISFIGDFGDARSATDQQTRWLPQAVWRSGGSPDGPLQHAIEGARSALPQPTRNRELSAD